VAYFRQTRLADGVTALFEPAGVGMTLIEGGDRALLIDTGYGFGDIASAAERLTSKPLIVCNSHVHADHAGGNRQFETVFCHGDDLPFTKGDCLKAQMDQLTGYGARKYPALRLLLAYGKLRRKRRMETQYLPFPREMLFDLGNRTVRLQHIPGHTPGSTVFLDERSATVFAGDAVNPAAFLFFDRTLRLRRYADRLDALAALPGYRTLRVSHDKEPLPFSFVSWYADFLRRANMRGSERTDLPNGERAVWRYAETTRLYGEVSVLFDEDNLKEEI